MIKKVIFIVCLMAFACIGYIYYTNKTDTGFHSNKTEKVQTIDNLKTNSETPKLKKYLFDERDLLKSINFHKIQPKKLHSFAAFLVFYDDSSIQIDTRFSKSNVYELNEPAEFLSYVKKSNSFEITNNISTPMEHIYFQINGKLYYGFGIMFDSKHNPIARFEGISCLPAKNPEELSKFIFNSKPVLEGDHRLLSRATEQPK